jgi:hypothetical protein
MDKRASVVSFGQPPSYATTPAEDATSGVSWAAVTGGGVAIAALSTAFLALGSGLGFASVSPWPNSGASATTIGVAAVAWLILMQLMASAMGGYLAGRLRTRWTSVHNDEVFFRDTAHGFLSWCLAAVLTAAFVAMAATVMSSAAIGGATAGATANPAPTENDYYLDTMFRSNGAMPLDPTTRAEASRILANGLATAEFPAADRDYLAKVVAARAGVSEAEAQQRVSAGITDARQAMDTARKAAAHVSIWSFVALLVGAFSASYAATIGGRQRDSVVAI